MNVKRTEMTQGRSANQCPTTSAPETGPHPAEDHRTSWLPLFWLLVLVALMVPVFSVRMPPVLDYPNHWARLWLVTGGAELPPLDAIYAVDWRGAWSNVGIDLLAVTVGRMLSADALAQVVLGLAVLLPVAGTVLLNRALYGSFHWWQLAFAVLAWNATFCAGLLNFQIGIGLALLAASTDARHGDDRSIARAFKHALFGALLGVVHIFATFFYIALLAALALGPDVRIRSLFQHPLRSLLRVLPAAAAAAAPACLVLMITPATPGLGPSAEANPLWEQYTLMGKAGLFSTAFITYDRFIEVPIVVALWAVARGFSRGGAMHVHRGLALAALFLFLFGLAIPSDLGGTALTDWRFPIMALLAFVSAVRPEAPSRSVATMAASTLVVLAVFRAGFVLSVWIEREQDGVAVERVLQHVPPGAAVLPAIPTIPVDALPRGRHVLGLPTFWHLPVLAIPLRRAFVPTLFTGHGTQPVHMRPPVHVLSPWNEIAGDAIRPVQLHELVEMPTGPREERWVGYARDWRRRFDYIIVLNADLGADFLTPLNAVSGLRLVADAGFARLYQVDRP